MTQTWWHNGAFVFVSNFPASFASSDGACAVMKAGIHYYYYYIFLYYYNYFYEKKKKEKLLPPLKEDNFSFLLFNFIVFQLK